jgi:predicted ATP-grasp superfamily ATP-dependent carboligase
VTNAHSRATLQIVRSLGSRKIPVYTGEKTKTTPTKFSRYLSGYTLYPDPAQKPKEFVRFINDYCLKNNIDIIFPVVDDALLPIAKFKHLFDKSIKIPISDYNSIVVGRDKQKTIEQCEKLNIPIPKTMFKDEITLSEIKDGFKLPVLIKPRESEGSRGIKVIRDWNDLLPEFEKVKKVYGTPMVQEFIPHGGAYGVEVLYNKGKMLIKFTHKRLREYPEGGGPSTLRMSTENEEMEEYAEKLMNSLSWHGVAMVEFRVSSEDNVPYLVEINPRYWGSLRLSIVSGLDFPYNHYLMTIGKNLEYKGKYNLNIQARWMLFGDILWFYTSKEKDKFKKFFKLIGKDLYYDIITKNDPLPAVGSFLEGIEIYTDPERKTASMDRGLE